MTDILTSEQRRRCMSAIKGKDTKPEMIVRKMVHAMGFRYRLHLSSLPGHPDMVFQKRKKIIFINGCFWHRHNCKLGRIAPATRTEFWEKKLNGNKQRDRHNLRKLHTLGWNVLIVWECWLKKPNESQLRILNFLDS